MSKIVYKVIHPLGCYILGLGQRQFGEMFEVSPKRAGQFKLDTVPKLKRVDPPSPGKRTSKPARKPDAPAGDEKEA